MRRASVKKMAKDNGLLRPNRIFKTHVIRDKLKEIMKVLRNKEKNLS